MSNVKPSYAQENDRVQTDVKNYAKTLFADLRAGATAQTKADLDKFNKAYKADGGLQTPSGALSELQEVQPGLSDSDILTLNNIANETTEDK